jgi:hypothetical protein
MKIYLLQCLNSLKMMERLLAGASAFGAGVEVMAVTLLPLVPGTGGIVIFSEALDDAMLVATEFLAGAFGDLLQQKISWRPS